MKRIFEKHVHVRLTFAQAQALSLVAENGWGSGTFASYIGDRRKSKATERAMEALDAAIRKAASQGAT